ncbi:MAG: PEGA domain-containing protein [Deltaproteobacteria bacterium]|nr:PEGA domain-containing protein [Deltaproteobacteria bacterium]
MHPRLLTRVLTSLLFAGLLPFTALASKITVTTDPPGATVQLDGVAQGTSPVTIPKVAPGTHLLKVSKEGFVTREDSLDVDGDSDFQLHAPLNPAPKVVESPKPAPAPEPRKDPPAPPPAPSSMPPPMPAHPPVAPKSEPKAQLPLPVSELPVAWGTQKKSLVLVVETVPPEAYVQVVGLQEAKRAPATFTGFAPGKIQLIVRAHGHHEKRVEVDLAFDARTRVVLDPL